jgi:predicted GIY-YIG superfamily endonuclease
MPYRPFYVYILASDTRELYVGITNNLARRIAEHREGHDPYSYVFRPATTRVVRV